jgi:ketosteroid isomerase-like protein
MDRDADRRTEREASFSRLVSAFTRKGYGAFQEAMRPDVELEVPGSSPLAGTRRGWEEVGRYLATLGQVLRSGEKPITFVHEGNRMIVTHVVSVLGPSHAVEMSLVIAVAFDEQGRVAEILVRPDDQMLFDRVLNAALGDFVAS